MSDSPLFNPFPGLRPFRSDEKHLFFGREDQIGELLKRLRHARFLAVVGSSGSGKSSLVRAGLLPELYGGTMATAGSHWEVVVMRPGGDPFTNLASALVDADLYDPEEEGIVDQVRTTLDRSALGLSEAVRQSDVEEGTNVLIVVDQFEEIFRFRDQGGRSQEEALAFVKLLLAASKEERPPVYVVLTMRSDYLGDCAQFRGLAQAVNEGEYLIPRLTRNQRRSAISGPVQVGGAEISKRLLTKLLNDAGDNPDQLPVLQHALMRTWSVWAQNHAEGEELDLRHYEATGGTEEALSRHADEIYDSLNSDEDRALCELLFKALTERVDDVRGIRRPVRLERLVEIVGSDQEHVEDIVNVFREPGCTFLMPPETKALAPETIIDISHESLMRVWRRLRRWVDDEAQSARIYSRLAETAQLHADGKAGLYHDPDLQIAQSWRETNHPTEPWAGQYGGGFETAMAFLDKSQEQTVAAEKAKEEARQRELDQANTLAETRARSARNLKWFGVGVSALALIALGLAVWAFGLRDEAAASALTAEKNAAQAVEERERAQKAESVFRREQGNVWLERALRAAKEKNHFSARLLAGRAVGFETMGREDRDEEFQQQYPVLLDPDSVESRRAMNLVARTPHSAPMWRGTVAATIGEPFRVTVDPNGQYFAASNGNGDIYIWHIDSGDLLFRHQGQGFPVYIEALADGETLLAAEMDDDKTTITRRALDPSVKLAFKPIELNGKALRVRASPDSTRCLVSLDHERQSYQGQGSCVWLDVPHMRVITERIEEEDTAFSAVNAIAYHPTEKIFLTGRIDGTVDVWGYEPDQAGEVVTRLSYLPERFPGVRFLCFSSDGQTVYINHGVGGAPNESRSFLCEWDAGRKALAEIRPFPAIQGRVSGATAHPKRADAIFISKSGPNAAWRLHELGTGEVLADLKRDVTQTSGVGNRPSYDDMCVSRDGRLAFRGMSSGEIEVVDLEAMESLVQTTTAQSRMLMQAMFSADGRWLLSRAAGGTQLVDLQSGETVETFERIAGAVFTPDGSELIMSRFIGAGEYALETVALNEDFDRAPPPKHLATLSFPASKMVLSQDGNYLALQFFTTGVIRMWNLRESRLEEVSHDETEVEEILEQAPWRRSARSSRSGSNEDVRIYGLAFRPNSTWLAACFEEGVKIWDVISKTLVMDLPSNVRVYTLAFSPDGRFLATAGSDTRVTLWDLSSPEPSVALVLDGHVGGYVRSLDFSPDGGLLASGGDDGAVILWDPATGEVLERLGGDEEWNGKFNEGIASVDFAPDGQSLVSIENNQGQQIVRRTSRGQARFPSRCITLWELDRDAEMILETGEDMAASPQFLDDRFLIQGGNGELVVFDRVEKLVIQRLPFPGEVHVLALSDDYRFAGVYCRRGMPGVSVIDLSTGEVIARKEHNGGFNLGMDFRADSNWFAASGPDAVYMWDLEKRELRTHQMADGQDVWCVKFSVDGTKLYAGGEYGEIVIFDASSFEELGRIQCSDQRISGIDVDPSGRYLATVGYDDGVVRLWSLENGEPSLRGEAKSGTAARSGIRFAGVGFHPFEPLLASVSEQPGAAGGLRLHRFSPASGELETISTHDTDRRFALAFSPSGRFLLASSYDSDFPVLPVHSFEQGSNWTDFLGYYQIVGSIVSPRGDLNLYRPSTFPFRPRLNTSHYHILNQEVAENVRNKNLLRHYLESGSLPAAMAIYGQLGDEDQTELKPEVLEWMMATVEPLAKKGELAAAEAVLDRVRRFAGDEAWPSASVATGELILAVARDEPEGIESLSREVMALAADSGNHLALQRAVSILLTAAEQKLQSGDLAGWRNLLDILLASPLFEDRPERFAPFLDRLLVALRESPLAGDLANPEEPVALGLALLDLGQELWIGAKPLGQSGEAFEALTTAAATERLIYSGDRWTFSEDSVFPGEGWNQLDFDTTTWIEDGAPIGFGDRDIIGLMKRGGLTYYARRFFEVAEDQIGPLQMDYRRDDGIVVYLNGQEVFRCDNMPKGTISHEVAALSASSSESTWFSINLTNAGAFLRPGRNLLAVEIHQGGLQSSDLALDLELAVDSRVADLLGGLTPPEITKAIDALGALLPNRIGDELEPLIQFCLAPALDKASPFANSPAMLLGRMQLQEEIGKSAVAAETFREQQSLFEDWSPAEARSWAESLFERLQRLEERSGLQ